MKNFIEHSLFSRNLEENLTDIKSELTEYLKENNETMRDKILTLFEEIKTTLPTLAVIPIAQLSSLFTESPIPI